MQQCVVMIQIHNAIMADSAAITMRKSGVARERYSASLPDSQARIIQLDAEIIAAMLSAMTDVGSSQYYRRIFTIFAIFLR